MKVTFLRHGALLPPFDNYNNLSLKELSQLAKQTIDPSIDPKKMKANVRTADYLSNQYDCVLVSNSKRTQDTASELNTFLDLPKFEITNELNEILFDPSQLITQSEYEKEKLSIIRHRLFNALVNGSNIETGQDVSERLMRLDNKLKVLGFDSILVITHGFFMRYLDIFYRQNSREFSREALGQAVNYDYATGFTITIN